MATGAFAPPTTILRLSSSSPPLRATFHPTPLRLALPSRSSPPTSRSGWLSLRAPAAKGSLRVRCGATVVDQSSFEAEVLSSEGPVLVEFVADWCGPCRLVAPMVDWAAKEYKDSLKVVKIDHDANPELVKEYKVYGLPTLILFKNGQKVPGSHREGAITKVKLKEYLDSLLESVSVS